MGSFYNHCRFGLSEFRRNRIITDAFEVPFRSHDFARLGWRLNLRNKGDGLANRNVGTFATVNLQLHNRLNALALASLRRHHDLAVHHLVALFLTRPSVLLHTRSHITDSLLQHPLVAHCSGLGGYADRWRVLGIIDETEIVVEARA